MPGFHRQLLISCETHFNSTTLNSGRPGNARSAGHRSERPVHLGPVEDGDGRHGVHAGHRGDGRAVGQSGAQSESCAGRLSHRDGAPAPDHLLRESGSQERRQHK